MGWLVVIFRGVRLISSLIRMVGIKKFVSRVLYRLYGIQETAANQAARSSGP